MNFVKLIQFSVLIISIMSVKCINKERNKCTCCLSSVYIHTSPFTEIMGSIWSWLGYPNTGKTNDPDPVTGLTSRDKYLVQSSWEKVRQHPVENGMALLNLFFKNFPEHQNLFPFRNIPLKDLPDSKQYQAHCNAVMYGVSSIVDAIDKSDLLVAILTKLGMSHKPRNVGEKEFMDLKVTIIELFSTFMRAEEVEAWKKTLNVAFDVVVAAIRNHHKQ